MSSSSGAKAIANAFKQKGSQLTASEAAAVLGGGSNPYGGANPYNSGGSSYHPYFNPSDAALYGSNFHGNYVTGNALWTDPRVNNAQRAMIQSNYYAQQGGNQSPYSQDQIGGAANGGYVGSGYSTGKDSYAYVSPYMTGGQNYISPTTRTDQMGNTVQYRGYANEPGLGAYVKGTQSPQDMDYSWERTHDPVTGGYTYNPEGAASAMAKDLTRAAAIRGVANQANASLKAAAAKTQKDEVISLRNYMANFGLTPGRGAATGTALGINPKAIQQDPRPQQASRPWQAPRPEEKRWGLLTQQPDILTQQPDMSSYINQLKEAQRRNRYAALDKAKSTALGSLDTEKANIAPTYYDARNQAAANSEVGAMNFAQYMAARGIKGAAGAMPEIYRNAGLQGQIGALDRQEASELGAIERQRANVETGYASDMAAAEADIEAQAMQATINQWNADRQYALQQAAADRQYALQQAAQELDQDRFDWEQSPSNPDYQYQLLANKRASLENAYQEIVNSYAPDTLKQQAALLKQQVEVGTLDFATAQAQLDQIKAQTKNYLHDANAPYNTGGGGGTIYIPPNPFQDPGGGKKQTSYTPEHIDKYINKQRQRLGDAGKVYSYVKNVKGLNPDFKAAVLKRLNEMTGVR